MAHFKSAESYGLFSREVRMERRYVRTAEAEEFLRSVATTCRSRIKEIPQGFILWRAQLGSDWDTLEDTRLLVAVPHPPNRMKPLRHCAIEGRANPKGIPCLYLSTTAEGGDVGSAALGGVRNISRSIYYHASSNRGGLLRAARLIFQTEV